MSFNELGLSEPLLRAIQDKGYDTPSPIQQQAIPAVLSGQDVMAAAQTGTGKTGAFAADIPFAVRPCAAFSGECVSAARNAGGF